MDKVDAKVARQVLSACEELADIYDKLTARALGVNYKEYKKDRDFYLNQIRTTKKEEESQEKEEEKNEAEDTESEEEEEENEDSDSS